jgi:hypothetical protein
MHNSVPKKEVVDGAPKEEFVNDKNKSLAEMEELWRYLEKSVDEVIEVISIYRILPSIKPPTNITYPESFLRTTKYCYRKAMLVDLSKIFEKEDGEYKRKSLFTFIKFIKKNKESITANYMNCKKAFEQKYSNEIIAELQVLCDFNCIEQTTEQTEDTIKKIIAALPDNYTSLPDEVRDVIRKLKNERNNEVHSGEDDNTPLEDNEIQKCLEYLCEFYVNFKRLRLACYAKSFLEWCVYQAQQSHDESCRAKLFSEFFKARDYAVKRQRWCVERKRYAEREPSPGIYNGYTFQTGFKIATKELSRSAAACFLKEAMPFVINDEKRNETLRQFFSGFFRGVVLENGIEFLDSIFDDSWDIEYRKFLMYSVDRCKDYWDWLERKGFSEWYWTKIKNIYPETDSEYEIAIQRLSEFKNYGAMLELIYCQCIHRRGDVVKTDDVIKVLDWIFHNDVKWQQQQEEIQILFKVLYKREDVSEEKLLRLEEKYIDCFDFNELKPMATYRKLSADPEFFIEIVKKSSGPKLCFGLKKIFPFNEGDELKKWMKSMSILLKNMTDKKLNDLVVLKIGSILANAPEDATDKIWPTKYVREVIEKFEELNNDSFRHGMRMSKFNSVGCRFVDDADPGGEWRQWSAEFRKDAEKIRFEYPKTAAILEFIAEDYERFGREILEDYSK